MKKTVCLDFDGVCNLYDGWKGEDELFAPRPHLGDFITSLLSKNKKVAIFSTRPPVKLRVWFLNWFPSMSESIDSGDLFFPTHKPPADCYLDDRAVRFNGSFDDVLPQVLNFKAHWEIKTLDEAFINHPEGSGIEIDRQGNIR